MTLDDAKASLRRYADHGVPTGDFLRAVLANDLMQAGGRADDTSQLILLDICSYVYNDIPANCHGSYKKVDAWIEAKQAAREQKGKVGQ